MKKLQIKIGFRLHTFLIYKLNGDPESYDKPYCRGIYLSTAHITHDCLNYNPLALHSVSSSIDGGGVSVFALIIQKQKNQIVL